MSDLYLTKDGHPRWGTDTKGHFNKSIEIIRGIDDHIARHYYIYGMRGEAKQIALPHDLVIWE